MPAKLGEAARLRVCLLPGDSAPCPAALASSTWVGSSVRKRGQVTFPTGVLRAQFIPMMHLHFKASSSMAQEAAPSKQAESFTPPTLCFLSAPCSPLTVPTFTPYLVAICQQVGLPPQTLSFLRTEAVLLSVFYPRALDSDI